MQRRRLLAAVGATSAALAGCTAGSDFPSSTETPEPCTAARPDPVDPNGEMEPYEYPERPDEWTAENVELFLQTFESTYRQHEILAAGTTAYGHSATVEGVQERDDGYRVELETVYYYESETDHGTVHADGPVTRVVYLVADDRLRRAEAGTRESTPDPTDGDTVACW
ncbi:hypothetical protein BRD14_08445 [Halobacteriales archaeon SW_5_68_122]|nr:MAG: hypothetical protein BRD14_08445 [Halobacteriales archaeon SW_5_68_122]